MESIKALNLTDFVNLMLATLAENPQVIDLRDKSKKIISLPVQYKQIIENILCADNGWRKEFSILIDIDEYFDDHFAWEDKLAFVIKQTLIELNKSFEYDFVRDKLLITFTQDEIDMIMSNYPNEDLRDTMAHFTNLLVDYIYTREYQEKYCDYSAIAVKRMSDMKNKEINDSILVEETVKSQKKVLSLFKKHN